MSAPRNTVDRIQERLVAYAAALDYASLPPEVAHAAKVRVIDTPPSTSRATPVTNEDASLARYE